MILPTASKVKPMNTVNGAGWAIPLSRSRRWRSQSFHEAVAGYLFILPGLLPMIVFAFLPIVGGLAVSLLDWNLVQPWKFAGLQNYAKLIHDHEFWNAFRVSATYMVGVVPSGTILALALALALNSGRRGVVLYRTIYFLPVVTATVAVGMLWRWLYIKDIGLIDSLLLQVGIEGPDWLGSVHWALPAVMIMSVWKGLGYTMVLYLAGLQGIPEHLYEAAKIDGAGAWQRFRHVTLPMLSPTTFFILVLGIIGGFQVFDQIFVMTAGGPMRSTVSTSFFIYETGFQFLKMGYAAAAAWIMFVVVFVATIIQWRLQSRWVHYE